jgi:hypothetical protein
MALHYRFCSSKGIQQSELVRRLEIEQAVSSPFKCTAENRSSDIIDPSETDEEAEVQRDTVGCDRERRRSRAGAGEDLPRARISNVTY